MGSEEEIEKVLGDEPGEREQALASFVTAREHERSAIAAKLNAIAKEAAIALTNATEQNQPTSVHLARFERSVRTLSLLRVDVAKSFLMRMADEGTRTVKSALAHSLQGTKTAEGRALLVHLLSDDEARTEAMLTIGVSPWPEVLPSLIEIAETDDPAARVLARAIAKCGFSSGVGSKEANAAADFLLELLDDDVLLGSAADALLRYGSGFPGLASRSKSLIKEGGKRRAIGLCFAALTSDDPAFDAKELVPPNSPLSPMDEASARLFLEPLLKDPDRALSQAALKAWRALKLHLAG